MHAPPFKRALLDVAAEPCCGVPAQAPPAAAARLGDLDAHMHCSVIGTCLGTAELRKLMARHVDVHGVSDLGVHHEAVTQAARGGEAARALNRLLDHRHDAQLRRFARVRGAAALRALWDGALQQGDVAGAYWALLTHRDATPELRQQAFGDVHMLSHLAGASVRADLRRTAALEHELAAQRERLAQQQQRLQAHDDERAALRRQLAQQATELAGWQARAERAQAAHTPAPPADSAALLALHTERRERAEQALDAAAADNARLRQELEHGALQAQALAAELAAAERLLRGAASSQAESMHGLTQQLHGRRVLYVGGRPSSAQAIRDLVQRHGGELQRHDGGLEDRKGQRGAAVAWADLVVFPVDCVDHDSATQFKRLCQRHAKPWLALRAASVTSFAAALLAGDAAVSDAAPPCRRHA